jgi:Cys-rich protein (TIGR01571 family)
MTPEQRENLQMMSLGLQLMLLGFLICAMIYGYYERERRRRVADANGGYPRRTGTYKTGIFDCIGVPSVCFPATCFTPILAAFNRAEADNRDCHTCDAVMSLKTPITQYHTRQSIRAAHDIENAPLTDFFQSVCCTPCAVAQDTMELAKRSAVPAAATEATPPAYVVQTSVPMEGVVHWAPPPADYEKVPAQCQV